MIRLKSMFDTSPHMAQKMREMLQKKSPIERLKMDCSMHETSKYLITRAILEDNPNLPKTGLKKELFLKFYGSDFDQKTREKIMNHFEQL